MNRPRRTSALFALTAAGALALTACATSSSNGDAAAPAAPLGSSLGTLWPSPPSGEVIAQGTVMDIGGDVELCLGAVAESYPPQCSGVPLEGWSWDAVDGAESEGDVSWGAYAVQGTFDGETFTRTQPPIPLALYDPMIAADPTGGEPGSGTEQELQAIQDELPGLLGASYLASYPQDGWLWVDVVWDDGTWQQAADDDYGPGTVLIRSAMQEVDG